MVEESISQRICLMQQVPAPLRIETLLPPLPKMNNVELCKWKMTASGTHFYRRNMLLFSCDCTFYTSAINQVCKYFIQSARAILWILRHFRVESETDSKYGPQILFRDEIAKTLPKGTRSELYLGFIDFSRSRKQFFFLVFLDKDRVDKIDKIEKL